jgi:predicted transcriptional regulator
MSKLRAVNCYEAGQKGRSTQAYGFDVAGLRDQLQANIASKTGTPAEKIQYSFRVDEQERFKGVLNLALIGMRVSEQSESPIDRMDARVEYELPTSVRIRVILAATVQSTIYSSRFVNHAIPLIVGWAALILVAWKLAGSVGAAG